MFCPLCQKKLEKTIFHNTEVDFCPQCLGLWFEKNELRLAKDARDKDLNWLDIDLWKDKKKFKLSPEEKLCPACRLPLYEVNYGESQIKVDLCNLCEGVWLDRGEFKKIIGYLKERADYEVLNRYLKNLTEEAFEVFFGPEILREEILDFVSVLKLLKYKLATQYPVILDIISHLPK